MPPTALDASPPALASPLDARTMSHIEKAEKAQPTISANPPPGAYNGYHQPQYYRQLGDPGPL